MRGLGVTLVIFVICLLVIIGYWVLGKNKLDQKNNDLQALVDQKTAEIEQARGAEQKSKELAAKLPDWLRSLKVFKAAVPNQIEDHIFFSNLTEQMTLNNVEFLGIDAQPGGQWLADMQEQQIQYLESIGVDTAAARQIKVAFYSVKLIGDYGDVLRVFENMKKYRRLYTVEQVVAPAAGGAGTVTQITDDTRLPIQLTGALYYGLPLNYLNSDELIKTISESLLGPTTVRLKTGVASRAIRLLNPPDKERLLQMQEQEREEKGKVLISPDGTTARTDPAVAGAVATT